MSMQCRQPDRAVYKVASQDQTTKIAYPVALSCLGLQSIRRCLRADSGELLSAAANVTVRCCDSRQDSRLQGGRVSWGRRLLHLLRSVFAAGVAHVFWQRKQCDTPQLQKDIFKPRTAGVGLKLFWEEAALQRVRSSVEAGWLPSFGHKADIHSPCAERSSMTAAGGQVDVHFAGLTHASSGHSNRLLLSNCIKRIAQLPCPIRKKPRRWSSA